jgi:release factor glutamine methyltransferase
MRLRNLLRPFYARFMLAWAPQYLSKTRRSRYQDVRVTVPPGVFHPGFYLSTRFMLRHLQGQPIAGKRLWEIGAGSGMVAIWCARRGGHVVASDISRLAVAAIQANAAANAVTVDVVLADLFTGLPPQTFDWIIINPPYYPREPQTEAENAFFCGAEFQYFKRLFAGLAPYCAANASLRMILSEDCNLKRIREIAVEHGWEMKEIERRRKMGEWNFIYSLHLAKQRP